MSLQARLSYRQLPELFYQTVAPTPVAAPAWLLFNDALADTLQLPAAARQTAAGLQFYSGNQLADWMQPTAQAYTGHQFGSLAPRLGDGRAILLAELQTATGEWFDLQLKGAGPTPFSRRGDGRAALGPVLREYLISEWMAAVGVPTTRALAAVLTGEPVYRDGPKPGAILSRVAASHIRVGTFQYAAMYGERKDQQALADYVIARHYPAAAQAANPYHNLLEQVCQAQASLIAHWMSLGFVHGVMNTDNMTVSGQTIDYGPCAFIDTFRRDARFSSIDEGGRYAYRNQPAIAQWNLARLAESLLPLLAEDESEAIALAMQVLNQFPAQYQQAWLARFGAKLGLDAPTEADVPFIEDWLSLLEQQQLDFSHSFRSLSLVLRGEAERWPASADAQIQHWLERWQQRLLQQGLSQQARQHSDLAALASQLEQVNPAFIPRNQLIEQILTSAAHGDLAPAQAFLAALPQIFVEHPQFSALPAAPDQPYRTFCGT